MKADGERCRGLRGRRQERRRGRGDGEAHFLLRMQGRKFMNGSHLSSCSKCKQHTLTKKNELGAAGKASASAPAEALWPVSSLENKKKVKLVTSTNCLN